MTVDVATLPGASVDDGDARHVITQALSHASSLTFWIGPRSFDFTLQSGVGEHRAEVTVHHADAPDDDPGAHYALTFTRLAWCDTHRRPHDAADRLCEDCVRESTEGDE